MSDQVLKPDIVNIEGRKYRNYGSTSSFTGYEEHNMYENEDAFPDESYDDEEEDIDDFEVIKINDNRYLTYIHVAKQYIGYLIGKKGIVKNRIQHETKTDLKFPGVYKDDDSIAIYGPRVSNLKAARRKINLIVTSSRMKQKQYTHFISIPLNSEDIMKNFEAFKEQVLKECSGEGVEESLFIDKNKLHLTIGVMCLMDNEERILVSKLLTDAKDKIIMPLLGENFPIKIKMKGISYMNDDPKKIDVLYGCMDENGSSDIIQKLADAVEDYFSKAGFVRKWDNRDKVNLHMTLMNSRYRNKDDNEDTKTVKWNKRERQSFDGSAILEKFKDYDFGEIELKQIHLSQMHTKVDDGYYQPTCVVSCTAD